MERGGGSVKRREGKVGREGSGRKETDHSLVITCLICRGLHSSSKYIK